MRRSLKIGAVVVVAAAIGFAWLWPYIEMEFAGSAHYTEQDTREYEFYTPELLKNMPRITSQYIFSYTNISGPQAFVWDVEFNGTTDTSRIYAYLESAGYKLQPTCHVEAKCWQTTSNNYVVTVAAIDSDKSVLVQVVDSSYSMPLEEQ